MRGSSTPELIGPVLYKLGPTGCWVPDYTRPGVKERIAREVDMIEDECYDRRKPK